jgi:hypothetical protein
LLIILIVPDLVLIVPLLVLHRSVAIRSLLIGRGRWRNRRRNSLRKGETRR